jgi:cold shock CspA family protein
MGSLRRGSVVGFDVERGTGELSDSLDGARYPFHCTAIADGTRQIDVGAGVAFVLARGQLGRVEAVEVLALDA